MTATIATSASPIPRNGPPTASRSASSATATTASRACRSASGCAATAASASRRTGRPRPRRDRAAGPRPRRDRRTSPSTSRDRDRVPRPRPRPGRGSIPPPSGPEREPVGHREPTSRSRRAGAARPDFPRGRRGRLRRRRDPRPLRGHQARRDPPHRAAEDDDAAAHPHGEDRGRRRVHRPEEAGPDLQDPQGAGQAERPDVRRRDAGSPARRLRLPPQPRLQLPALPRRHLRLAQPDPPLRPQDRRHRRRPDPAPQGERALLRPAAGRGDQLRGPRQAQREGRLRRPDPAAPAGPDPARERLPTRSTCGSSTWSRRSARASAG